MAEEIPDNYPQSCKTRAALSAFELSVFTEDSDTKIEETISELARKLNHSGCTKSELGNGTEEDLLKIFKPVQSVVIVKEAINTNKESVTEKNRSIISPKMLGLNSPEQDLNQLSEFERLSSKSQYDQVVKQQTFLRNKLMHFISYLAMINCQKQISLKSDSQLQEATSLKNQVEWFDHLVKQHQRVKDASDKKKDGEKTKQIENEAYINPDYKMANLKVSIDTKLCIMELTQLSQRLQEVCNNRRAISQMNLPLELMYNSFIQDEISKEKTQEDLLNVGHLQIQNAAAILSKQIKMLAIKDHSSIDKIRISLGLGALTRDVNHILDATTYLGQSLHQSLKTFTVEKNATDYQLNKSFGLDCFDLLRDFGHLSNLLPQGFKVEKEPIETISIMEYKASMGRYHHDLFVTEDYDIVSSQGDENKMVYFRYHREYKYSQCIIVKITPDEDGGETNWTKEFHQDASKTMMIDLDGSDIILTQPQSPTPKICRYIKEYGIENDYYDEEDEKWFYRQESSGNSQFNVVKFKYTHLFEIRKEFDESRLCVVHDAREEKKDQEEEKKAVEMAKRTSRYYLLTVKKPEDSDKKEFKVKKITFGYNIADEEHPKSEDIALNVKQEVVLEIEQEQIVDLIITDFKVAEETGQFRLIMKHKEKAEFQYFGFSAESGKMVKSFGYNNQLALVSEMEEQAPLKQAWLCQGEELKIIDRRQVEHTHDAEEFKKLKQYNTFKVSITDKKPKFFEQILDVTKMKEDLDSASRPYYEGKVRTMIHDATAEQKKLQAQVEDKISKRMPLVNSIECMYLLSQLLRHFAKKFLTETKEAKGIDSRFIQSDLCVMQKSQTFVSLTQSLKVLVEISNEIERIQNDLAKSSDSTPKTDKLVSSCKERVGLVFNDLKLVLACNLNALKRDERITLQELKKGSQDYPSCLYQVALFENMIKLDAIYKEALKDTQKLEELGIDSQEIFASILQCDNDTFEDLIEIAKKQKIEGSDDFLQLVSRYHLNVETSILTKARATGKSWSELKTLAKENKSELLQISPWVIERINEFLHMEEPSQVQKQFVQSFFTKIILDVVIDNSDDEVAVKLIGQMLAENKMVEKHTKLSLGITQTLVMTLYLKDQKQSSFVTMQSIDLILNSKGFPKALQRDLFCLVGRKVLDQVNPTHIRDTLNTSSATNLIMQSNLLSGGLQSHLFGYFTPESLKQMLCDAQLGNNDDLTSQIKDAITTLEENKFESQFSEDDVRHLEIIHEGKNDEVDKLIKGLQLALKKRGGLVATYCNAGQEEGMLLTRSAFAVMIKFTSLTETITSMIDKLEEDQMTGELPEQAGPERDVAIVKAITSIPKSDEVVKCWANATQMRRWLTQKKQSLGKRFASKGEEDWEAGGEKELKMICEKIMKKAELLVALQSPTGVFKSSEPIEYMPKQPSFLKKDSIDNQNPQKDAWKQSVQLWHEEQYDFGKLKSPNETASEIKEAGTTSVLACLQSPIEADQIISQVMTCSRKAILRLSAFRMIDMLLECDQDQVALIEIVAWFVSFQSTSSKLLHYTDGIKGCGMFFEEKLRQSFFNVLSKLGSKISIIQDKKVAQALLHGFDCKFLGRDFGLLHDKVKIFNILFRGGNTDNNLIKDCQSFYISSKSLPLAKTLQQTFLDVYLAIIARISEPDAVETFKIKDQGFTNVPELLKQKSSITDNPWSELLVGQALDEIFRIFQKVIKDKERLPTKRVVQLLKKQSWFDHPDVPETVEDDDSDAEHVLTKAQILVEALIPIEQKFLTATNQVLPEIVSDNEDYKEKAGTVLHDFIEQLHNEKVDEIKAILSEFPITELQQLMKSYDTFKASVESAVKAISKQSIEESKEKSKEVSKEDTKEESKADVKEESKDEEKDDSNDNEDSTDISEEETQKLINDAVRVYDMDVEKNCLDYYFSMIYLLSNVAQVAPIPLKMLRTIATPYHLRLLFELLLVVSPKSKLKILKIITSLIANQIPSEVFTDAFKGEPLLDHADEPALLKNSDCSLCARFLYHYAVQIRKGQQSEKGPQKNMFAVSKQLLKLSLSICNQETVQEAFEQAVLCIEKVNQAEQDILMEIVGASLDKICVNDEVKYAQKYRRTKTAELETETMIVVKTEGLTDLNEKKTLKLFSKSSTQFIEVVPSVLELVTLSESVKRPIKVSKAVLDHIVSLILGSTSDNVTVLLKVQFIKWILKDINCLTNLDETTQSKLSIWLDAESAKQWSLLATILAPVDLFRNKIIGIWKWIIDEDQSCEISLQQNGTVTEQHCYELKRWYTTKDELIILQHQYCETSENAGDWKWRDRTILLKLSEDGKKFTTDDKKFGQLEFIKSLGEDKYDIFDYSDVAGAMPILEEKLSTQILDQVETKPKSEKKENKDESAEVKKENQEISPHDIVLEPKEDLEKPKEVEEQKGPKRRSITRNFFNMCNSSKKKVVKQQKLTSKQLNQTETKLRLLTKDFTSDSLMIVLKASYALQSSKEEQDQYLQSIRSYLQKLESLKEEPSSLTEATAILKDMREKVAKEAHKLDQNVDQSMLLKTLEDANYEPVHSLLLSIIKAMSSMCKVMKESFEFWELFQVISDAEWLRYKRVKKADTLMYTYHHNSNKLRILLESNEENEKVEAQFLLSKMCQRLHFASQAVSKDKQITKATVKQLVMTYRDTKLTKLSNYQLTGWLKTGKNFDGQVLLKAFDNLFESSAVQYSSTIAELIDQAWTDLKLSQINCSNEATPTIVTNADLLMKVSTSLLKERRPFNQFAVKLTDCLFLSIQQLYQKTGDDEIGSRQRHLLIRIRKIFICLESIFLRIEDSASSFLASGNQLKKIIELKSLIDLVNKLPTACKDIRSLFGYLLLGIVESLTRAANKVGEDCKLAEPLLRDISDVRLKLDVQLTDFEPEAQTKRENKIDKVEPKILTIDSLDSAENVDGWFKIDLTGATNFKVKIALEESKSSADSKLKPPTFVAISTEPKKNAETTVHQLCEGKHLDLSKSEGSFYLKYPFNQKYFMTLRHKLVNKTDKKKEKNLEFMKIWIPNIDYDGMKYTNGYQISLESRAENKVLAVTSYRLEQANDSVTEPYYNHDIKMPKGEKIKYISNQVCASLFSKLRAQNGINYGGGCRCAYDSYTVLSECGKLYSHCMNCKKLSEYPKLHSNIGRIDQICATSNYKNMFVIDTDGKLFEIFNREDDDRVLVINKMLPILRDGSTLKKVHLVCSSLGQYDDNQRVTVIKATTSNDQVVFASASRGTNPKCLGRPCSEETKKDAVKKDDKEEKKELKSDFHILSYEPELTTFVQVVSGISCVLAIDEDGEIWILCGRQNTKKNLNLPTTKEQKYRDITRPIMTNWMRKLRLKAIRIDSGARHVLVQTEDEQTGKKGVLVINYKEKVEPDYEGQQLPHPANFSKMIENFFVDYEKYFEIVDMYAGNEEGYEQELYANFLVKTSASKSHFKPLIVETVAQTSLTSDESAEPMAIQEVKITDELVSRRDWNLTQVNHLIAEQLKTKGKETLAYLNNNMNKSNFITDFLTPLIINIPIIIKEDDEQEKQIDSTDEKKERVKKFISKYISTFQTVFDLIPLFCYICDDPYLSRCGQSQRLLEQYMSVCKLTRQDLIQRIILVYISNKTFSANDQHNIIFDRIQASEFKLLNRHEKQGESKTLFSMLADGFKDKFLELRRGDRRPFYVTLRSEGACDCGGPMRDLISDVCAELMSDDVPILVPTSNNLAKVEPFTDCYRMNPQLSETHWLKKLIFFGYFLGWSLRSMGGLGIDLPPSFWNRICGGPTYVYTMDDLRSMDIYRYDTLIQLQNATKTLSKSDFNVMFDDYKFEADFGTGVEYVELCEGGAAKQITIENVDEYINLYLKKYTAQEDLQFKCVYQGIQDVCGKRLLIHMLPHLASRRACASSKIDIKTLKAVVSLHCYLSIDDEDQKKKAEKEAKDRFWRVMETFSHEDRQLLVKFATGRTRLAQGDDLTVSIDEGDENRLPSGGTCGNQVSFPNYSTDDMMSSKLLIAIRLCGEIDNDGYYGSEYGDEEENKEGEERGVDNYSDDQALQRMNWSLNEGGQGDSARSNESGSDEEDEEKQDGEEGMEGLDAKYAF